MASFELCRDRLVGQTVGAAQDNPATIRYRARAAAATNKHFQGKPFVFDPTLAVVDAFLNRPRLAQFPRLYSRFRGTLSTPFGHVGRMATACRSEVPIRVRRPDMPEVDDLGFVQRPSQVLSRRRAERRWGRLRDRQGAAACMCEAQHQRAFPVSVPLSGIVQIDLSDAWRRGRKRGGLAPGGARSRAVLARTQWHHEAFERGGGADRLETVRSA